MPAPPTPPPPPEILPRQTEVYKFYEKVSVQIFVAVLIFSNFLTNIVEKEIDPHGTDYKDVWYVFETFFNICFLIELCVNMYAKWFFRFWEDGWNVFDVIVVSIGIMNTISDLAGFKMPDALNMLRMMRAFRVFRLFKRVQSLNKIIVAIIHSLPGVRDAFLILTIVMSIFAILAVEFYHELGSNCKDPDSPDHRFETSRGYCLGNEYYGTFARSLYTFFQVLTGESWSEAVARPTIWFWYDSPYRAVGSAFFFVLYVLITAFVLTNVVVAVLLDKMVDPEVAAAATHKDPDTEDDDEGKGDGTTAPANGEDTSAPPNAEDLRKTMSTVTDQVDQLMAVSERMSSELETFRADMSLMRDQVANLIRIAVPGN